MTKQEIIFRLLEIEDYRLSLNLKALGLMADDMLKDPKHPSWKLIK